MFITIEESSEREGQFEESGKMSSTVNSGSRELGSEDILRRSAMIDNGSVVMRAAVGLVLRELTDQGYKGLEMRVSEYGKEHGYEIVKRVTLDEPSIERYGFFRRKSREITHETETLVYGECYRKNLGVKVNDVGVIHACEKIAGSAPPGEVSVSLAFS